MPGKRSHLSSTGVGLAVKDALRGARFLLRRGRDFVVDAAPRDVTPPREVLAGVDLFAEGIDEVAKQLRAILFDLPPAANGSACVLERLEQSDRSASRFAELAYAGLRAITGILGARYIFVSEARAAEAFDAACCAHEDAMTARAAALFENMRDGHVLIEVVNEPGAAQPVAIEKLESVALFALLLWMQAEPASGAEETREAIEDCARLAIAISDQITRDLRGAELRQLFEAYRDKV